MRNRATKAPSSKGFDGVLPAVVVTVGDAPGRLDVHVASRTREARLALASPYEPAEGDRVLVAEGGGELYVIGLLHAARPASLPIPGGGEVLVRDGAVEITDAAGRVVVRWAAGSAEILAPSGDLKLSAPSGRVSVRAAEGVDIAAGADDEAPQIRVGPVETRVASERLFVRAGRSDVETSHATMVAERIAVTAASLAHRVEHYELTATRLVEKTRDTFRDASDLAQTRVGRARTIVKDVYALFSRRTTMASTDDTSIDGSKVLLG